MKCLDNVTDSMDMNLCELQETVEDKGALHATVHGVSKGQTRLSSNDNFHVDKRKTVMGQNVDILDKNEITEL